MRSPALISPDTVRSCKAMLRGSMRRPDQNESSPIRCCLAWQALHTGVFTPLLRRLALRCDDLVEIGARRDAKLEAVIGFRVLRHIMKDGHDQPLPWRSVPRAC